MSQGQNRPPHQNARTYPKTCEPREDDGFSLLRAPPSPPIALPEKEDCEDFSYSGPESDPDQRGGLMVNISDPLIPLDCIDDIFPDGLLMVI